MAAGDLITADWQLELRAVLMGATSVYQLDDRTGITGLGEPPAKTADTDLAHADGAYGSRDYRSTRIITVGLFIHRATPALAMTSLATLKAAWAPATTDIPLHLRLPGLGHVSLTGRPRELDVSITRLKFGRVDCLGTFVALDPTITTVA